MGFCLISVVTAQLVCALCAYKLGRPTIWLQIILLVPVFGTLAYCGFEILRPRMAAKSVWSTPKAPADESSVSGLGRFGYQAVCARTAEARRALAEECMRLGRHADARLLFESCMIGPDARDPELIERRERAAALMQATAPALGDD